MRSTIGYPRRYNNPVDRVVHATGMDCDTAYTMLLLTATLMDLFPDSEDVVAMVINDSLRAQYEASHVDPG